MEITYLCVNDDGEVCEIKREFMLDIGSAVMIGGDLWCVIKTLNVSSFSNYLQVNCPICKKGTVFSYKEILFRCNFCLRVLNRKGQNMFDFDFEVIKQPGGYQPSRIYGPELPEDKKPKLFQVSDSDFAKHSRLSKVKKKPKRYKIGNSWI